MNLQTLTHTQIKHDLLTSTRNSISTNITVKTLDLTTLPTTTITQTTEDLTSLAGAELEGLRGLGLQAGNGSAELQHCLGFFHALALEDDVLEPVVSGFDLAGHVREFHADDGVVDKTLAEGLALVGVFDGFLVAYAGEADALDDNSDSLVVKVCHNDCVANMLVKNSCI